MSAGAVSAAAWGAVTVAAAAGAVVARDLLDVPLWAAVAGLVGIAALGLAAVVLGVDGIGRWLLVLAVGTSTWNAVAAGPAKPGPVLLALALVVLLVLHAGAPVPVRVPGWVWVLGGTVLLVAAAAALSPPSPAYMSARYVGGETVTLEQLQGASLLNVVEAGQWLVAAVALPVAACLAVRDRPGLPLLLVDAWIVGATVNAAVGIADEWAGTTVSEALLGAVDIGGRQAGLTVQPNHLAVAVAVTLPVALWRTVRRGRLVLMAACVAVLAVGLVTTGSRGGLAAAVLACGVVLLADRRIRGHLAVLGVLGVAAGVLVAALRPQVLAGLAEDLRLTGDGGGRESDAIRERIAQQALADFAHDPVRGVGLEVVVQGHSIWLQLLASGGVVLLVGFLVTCTGFGLDALAQRRASADLSMAMALAAGTWLVVGVVENNLTDLFLYVPFAVVAALHALERPGPGPITGTVPIDDLAREARS